MQPSTSTCQITQLKAANADLTKKLEEERAYSRMLELDMEAKIEAAVKERTAVQVQGTFDDLKLNDVVDSLMKYREDGYEVVQVAT